MPLSFRIATKTKLELFLLGPESGLLERNTTKKYKCDVDSFF